MHLVVTSVFLIFSNIQNHKATTIEASLKVKCFPIFYFLFFFFFQQKDYLYDPPLPNVVFPLLHVLSLKRQCGPLGSSSIWLFLRTLLTLKTLHWCLVQAQASGWQWPNPCHVNPQWMARDSNFAVHGMVRWALTTVFPSQLWLHLKP